MSALELQQKQCNLACNQFCWTASRDFEYVAEPDTDTDTDIYTASGIGFGPGTFTQLSNASYPN